MTLQTKGLLFIMLIAGDEANRVNQKVELSKLLNSAEEFAKKAGAQGLAAADKKTGDWGCDDDVIVQAKYDKHKYDMRVTKSQLTSPVLLGRKTKAGCEVLYSLLCNKGKLTYRREAAECSQLPNTCEACAADNNTDYRERKDRTFGFFAQWRTIGKQERDSSFTFDPGFIKNYADERLPDCDKVHLTPAGEDCEEVKAKLEVEEAKLKASKAVDTGDLKSATAVLRPFQKLYLKYDKMGCENAAGPALDEGFPVSMVGKLRETFVKNSNDNENAQARFDGMLVYLKEHADSMTLKKAINAAGIAFGTSPEAEDYAVGKEDSDLEQVEEDKLEDTLVAAVSQKEPTFSIRAKPLKPSLHFSFAEVHDGQVASNEWEVPYHRRRFWAIARASATISLMIGAVIAVIICIVVFGLVALWVGLGAVALIVIALSKNKGGSGGSGGGADYVSDLSTFDPDEPR